jgi:hypothetical protein
MNLNRSFQQDRLGTNIGKTQKTETVFFLQAMAAGGFESRMHMSTGAETPFLRGSFLLNRPSFAKTGSGQRRENIEQKGVSAGVSEASLLGVVYSEVRNGAFI